MTKNIAIILLVLTFSLLAMHYYASRRDEPRSMPQMPTDSNLLGQIETLEDKLASKEAEIARLKSQLSQVGDSTTQVDAAAPVKVVSGSKTSVQAKKAKANFNTPEYREKQKKRRQAIAANRIERRYADLLTDFGLTADEADQLRDLLLAREDSTSEAADKKMTDAALRKFLGDEGYEYLEWYDETRRARSSVKDLQVKLASQDLLMTREQQDHMIGIYHQVAANEQSHGLPKVQTFDGDSGALGMSVQVVSTGGSTGDLDASLDKLSEGYNQIIADAGAVLDESQLSILGEHLHQKLRKKESEAEIARSMMSNRGDTSGTSTNAGQTSVMTIMMNAEP